MSEWTLNGRWQTKMCWLKRNKKNLIYSDPVGTAAQVQNLFLQQTGKIMRIISIPAEFSMTGRDFECLPFKFLLNIRDMGGRSSYHSYKDELKAWVLLCKLLKNYGGLGVSNQNVLQVAQRCPTLHHIYVFFPLLNLVDPSKSRALGRVSAWTRASLPVKAFMHSFLPKNFFPWYPASKQLSF